MTASMSERTVLPPEQPERLVDMLSLLVPGQRSRATLIGPDGTHLELPSEVFEVLRDVIQAMAQGMAITVAPQHMVLTTSEAAQLLGMSRPTLVRLLEAGKIPFEQPNRHRRIRLRDVLAYQERSRRGRAAGLDMMVRDAEDNGLYDLPLDTPVDRLPIEDTRRRSSRDHS